jgi:hypothetical protein
MMSKYWVTSRDKHGEHHTLSLEPHEADSEEHAIAQVHAAVALGRDLRDDDDWARLAEQYAAYIRDISDGEEPSDLYAEVAADEGEAAQ